MNTVSIQHQALPLPASQRADLAARVLASLDDLPASEIDGLWCEQAVLRAREIDQSLVQVIPGDQVKAEALALCR